MFHPFHPASILMPFAPFLVVVCGVALLFVVCLCVLGFRAPRGISFSFHSHLTGMDLDDRQGLIVWLCSKKNPVPFQGLALCLFQKSSHCCARSRPVGLWT